MIDGGDDTNLNGNHGVMQRPLPDITLMSLNLRFGLADDGENGWQHRQKAYPALFESYPADFLLFQEANDFQVSFLHRLLAPHRVIGQRHQAPEHWQNNVIFHHPRWRCLRSEHFYLSPTPDIPSQFVRSQWPRQCSMGTFQCGPRTLTVINTHFDFANEVQCLSADLIRRKAFAQAADWPMVLAGDFNAEPASDCYAIFTDGKEGLRNAFELPGEGTFHGFSGKSRGGAIDWVLYRGTIKVRSALVIQKRFGGRYPSDHFPLWVRFGQSGPDQ